MAFIDDENLKACHIGLVFGTFNELSDIVNPTIGRGVHFDDVDMTVFIGTETMLAGFTRA